MRQTSEHSGARPTGARRVRAALEQLSLLGMLLIGAALIALPAGILGLIGDLHGLNQDRQAIINTNLSLTQTVGAIIDGTFDEAIAVGWSVASDPEVATLSPAAIKPRLQRLRPVYPEFANIVVVDANGRIEGAMNPLPPGVSGINLANVRWLRAAIDENRAQVGTTFISPYTGRPSTGVAVPVRGSGGEPIGAVVVELDLTAPGAELSELPLSGQRLIVITDPLGRVMYSSQANGTSTALLDLSDVPLIRSALAGNTVVQTSGPFNGVPGNWLGAASRTPRHSRVVAVIQPVEVAIAPFATAIVYDAAGVLAVLILATIGSIFVSRRILGPVRTLERAARAWAAGSLAERARVSGPRELATLARTFNTMAESLSRSLEQLREADQRLVDERNRLQAILQTSPAGILVVDESARVVLANPAAESLLGQTDRLDLPLGDFVPPYPMYRRDGTPVLVTELPIMRALREGVSIFGEELVVRRPNGWEVHLLTNSAPIRGLNGTVGAVMVFFDITVLVEEERLRTEFVLSAAHEFRNPLTVVKGYAEVAMRDPSVRDTNVYRELARIVDAANRASQLAEQLIRAARLHLPPLVLRKAVVDLDRLVEETVRRFEKAPGHPHVSISLCLRPAQVEGDPLLLSEALTDLLRHAASVSTDRATIEVGVSAWDGIVTVSVTDHGPPIPPEELSSLFTPFVPPTTARAEGTPSPRQKLPLYLARRIVEESGGWIRASSDATATTISITLPRYPLHETEEPKSDPTEAGGQVALPVAVAPGQDGRP